MPVGVAYEEMEMGEFFTPSHLLLIGVVAFVVFGARKLPESGRGLGDGIRGFSDGLKGLKTDFRDQTASRTKPKSGN